MATAQAIRQQRQVLISILRLAPATTNEESHHKICILPVL